MFTVNKILINYIFNVLFLLLSMLLLLQILSYSLFSFVLLPVTENFVLAFCYELKLTDLKGKTK